MISRYSMVKCRYDIASLRVRVLDCFHPTIEHRLRCLFNHPLRASELNPELLILVLVIRTFVLLVAAGFRRRSILWLF